MIPFALHVDIFKQFRDLLIELAIVDSTQKELERIREKANNKDKAAAKMALESIDKLNIEILNTSSETETESFLSVDTQILDIAQEKGYGVATQDKELKKRLREAKVPVYYLRQKKYIQRQ
jgi:uncharacterized protein